MKYQKALGDPATKSGKILKTGRETNYSQKLLDEENEDNEDLNTKASTQDN